MAVGPRGRPAAAPDLALTARATGPAALRLPFPLRSVPAVVSWHHRHDSDPAHQWLRSVVTEVVSMRLGLAG